MSKARLRQRVKTAEALVITLQKELETERATVAELKAALAEATNAPLPHTSTITNTPIHHTSTITNAPIPHTVTITKTPLPHTSTITNSPIPHTSTITNSPIPHTSTITNTPLPQTLTITKTPLPHTSTITNTPLPHTSTITNTPLPHTSTITNAPLPHTSSITKSPPPPLPVTQVTRREPPLYEGQATVQQYSTSFGDTEASKLDPNALEQLYLNNCPNVQDSTLEILSTRLLNLATLDLSSCRDITNAGLSHLSHLSTLKKLGLYQCSKITDLGITEFAKTHALRLRNIDLRGCRVTSIGVQEIAVFCGGLEELYLGANEIGDTGMLAIREGLKNLKMLNIQSCSISDRAFGLTVRELSFLTEVSIDFGKIGDAGICLLPQSVKTLRFCFLEGFTDIGLEWVLSNLKLVTLSIDRTGVKGSAILSLPKCPTLKSVTLTPFLTNEHMKVLASTNITSFNLFSNPGITDLGASYILTRQNVSFICLNGCSVSKK